MISTAPPTFTAESNSVSFSIAVVFPIARKSTFTVASAPLQYTSPALSTTRPASVFPPFTPTLSSNKIFPVPAVRVNVRVLPVSSSTSSRMILPSFVVKATSEINITAELSNLIAAPASVVSISAPKLTFPASSNHTVPAEVIFAFISAGPLLVIVTVPALVVFSAAFSVSVAVFISTVPPAFTSASNSVSFRIAVVLPIVRKSTSTVASTPLKCMSPALSTTSPASVLPPFTPILSSIITLPVPAVSVSVRALPVSSSTSSRVILPLLVVTL